MEANARLCARVAELEASAAEASRNEAQYAEAVAELAADNDEREAGMGILARALEATEERLATALQRADIGERRVAVLEARLADLAGGDDDGGGSGGDDGGGGGGREAMARTGARDAARMEALAADRARLQQALEAERVARQVADERRKADVTALRRSLSDAGTSDR